MLLTISSSSGYIVIISPNFTFVILTVLTPFLITISPLTEDVNIIFVSGLFNPLLLIIAFTAFFNGISETLPKTYGEFVIILNVIYPTFVPTWCMLDVPAGIQ